MRVLVASTGGAGHFGPLISVLGALSRRGDDVLVVVPPELEARVAGSGHRFRIGEGPRKEEVDHIWEQFPIASRAERAVLVDRELFARLCTAAMLPVIERACEERAPDLVVREPCEYASAIAAERRGIPHVQVAISMAEVEAGALELAAPVLEPLVEGIVERLRRSPYLTRFPGSLDPSPYPATRRFRESGAERRRYLPDWWNRGDWPLVYATFGTVAGRLPIGAAAFRMALDAVAGLHARVLLTVGRETDIPALGPIPDNVHVEPWVDQADAMDQAAVVVCHGGSGTTFGALAAGVPVVLVPLFADQLTNASRVATTGAGVTLELDRGPTDDVGRVGPGDPQRLRVAIEGVLGDTAHRAAATRIAEEMSQLPVVDEMVTALEADLARAG